MKQFLPMVVCKVVVAGLLFAGVRRTWSQAATAIPQLDLNRSVGVWYEVARLPDKAQKRCVSNAMVLLALQYKPREFQLVNSCQVKSGETEARNAYGVIDKQGSGQVKVTYLWPFSTKYRVLAVGPAYEWAVVGSANHKSLWVLSRTTAMTPELLAETEAKAAAEGFDRSKLVIVPQTH